MSVSDQLDRLTDEKMPQRQPIAELPLRNMYLVPSASTFPRPPSDAEGARSPARAPAQAGLCFWLLIKIRAEKSPDRRAPDRGTLSCTQTFTAISVKRSR
jgi:hypothetical protein